MNVHPETAQTAEHLPVRQVCVIDQLPPAPFNTEKDPALKHFEESCGYTPEEMDALLHIRASDTPDITVPPPSLHIVADWDTESSEVRNDANAALLRASPRPTSTIDARIPMIATTIRSSIRVNPFLFFFMTRVQCETGNTQIVYNIRTENALRKRRKHTYIPVRRMPTHHCDVKSGPVGYMPVKHLERGWS